MGIRKDDKLIPLRQELDWNDLSFFLAIAEEKSLSKAARRLRTTQPTVSKRLIDLERRLGASLAVRSTSGIQLTEEGRFVAAQASAMARSVQHITQEVAMRDHEVAGEVTITCPDALLTYFIAPAVTNLHRVHPSIGLVLKSRREDHDPPSDITIQFHETKRMEDVAIGLGWVHHIAFAARSYLDLYGGPQDIGEAFQHRMLMHTSYIPQSGWRPKQEPLQEILDYAVRTDCGTTLVAITANGGGIASMPTYVSRVDPRLVALDVGGELARVRFWMVFDRERGQLPRVRETIEWLRRVFEPGVNPWFREEFIRPEEFESAITPGGGRRKR